MRAFARASSLRRSLTCCGSFSGCPTPSPSAQGPRLAPPPPSLSSTVDDSPSGSSLLPLLVTTEQRRAILSPQSFFQATGAASAVVDAAAGEDSSSFLAAFKTLQHTELNTLKSASGVAAPQFPSTPTPAGGTPRRGGRGGGRRGGRGRQSSNFYVGDASGELDPEIENPYAGLRINRAEENFQLSIDANARKLREEFLNGGPRRCRLCAEHFKEAPGLHQSFVPHTAREALANELLRAYCGTPEEIADMWWWRLDSSRRFQRIRSLSSDNHEERRKRLFYLLEFLRDRHIIRECFNVSAVAAGGGAGRSWEFERLEWVGDNVVKYVFSDRISVLFPLSEGGVKGRLVFLHSLIDGNDGLARAYDHLGFERLTGSDKVISKFKSDVVEALFGELQVFLWSTELAYSPDAYDLPMGNEFITIRALVRHVMEEVAHCMLMYHIRHVLSVVKDIVKDSEYKYVKTDPGLKSNAFLRSQRQAELYAGATPGSSGSSTATPSKDTAYSLKPAAERKVWKQETTTDATTATMTTSFIDKKVGLTEQPVTPPQQEGTSRSETEDQEQDPLARGGAVEPPVLHRELVYLERVSRLSLGLGTNDDDSEEGGTTSGATPEVAGLSREALFKTLVAESQQRKPSSSSATMTMAMSTTAAAVEGVRVPEVLPGVGPVPAPTDVASAPRGFVSLDDDAYQEVGEEQQPEGPH